MAGNASDTRKAVHAAHQAASTLAHFNSACRPLAAARRLNLPDHDHIANDVCFIVRYLAHALNEHSNMVRYRYGELGDPLAKKAESAAKPINSAAGRLFGGWDDAYWVATQLRKDIEALGSQAAAHRGSFTGAPRAATAANRDVRALREQLRAVQYGVRVDGLAEVAALFGDMLRSFGAATGNLANLAAASYETPIEGSGSPIWAPAQMRRHGRHVAARYDQLSGTCSRASRMLGGPAAGLADDATRAQSQVKTGAR